MHIVLECPLSNEGDKSTRPISQELIFLTPGQAPQRRDSVRAVSMRVRIHLAGGALISILYLEVPYVPYPRLNTVDYAKFSPFQATLGQTHALL